MKTITFILNSGEKSCQIPVNLFKDNVIISQLLQTLEHYENNEKLEDVDHAIDLMDSHIQNLLMVSEPLSKITGEHFSHLLKYLQFMQTDEFLTTNLDRWNKCDKKINSLLPYEVEYFTNMDIEDVINLMELSDILKINQLVEICAYKTAKLLEELPFNEIVNLPLVNDIREFYSHNNIC